MGEAIHTCRHRCRSCGVEVIATACSHAEALEECPLCEERRYNGERQRLRCGNCDQLLERRTVTAPTAEDYLAIICESLDAYDPAPFLDRASFAQAAAVLRDLRRAKATIALAEAAVERHLATTMGPETPGARIDERGRFCGVEVPGVGVIVRRARGGRTGWDHDATRQAVVARLADEIPYAGAVTDDGERVPVAAVVGEVVAAWTKACGYQWKTTGLKALGLDVDEYSQWTPKDDPDACRWSIEVQ